MTRWKIMLPKNLQRLASYFWCNCLFEIKLHLSKIAYFLFPTRDTAARGSSRICLSRRPYTLRKFMFSRESSIPFPPQSFLFYFLSIPRIFRWNAKSARYFFVIEVKSGYCKTNIIILINNVFFYNIYEEFNVCSFKSY